MDLTAQQTAADLQTLRRVYQNYWAEVPATAWERRTGARPQDWTLHQTLAHLVAVARLFNDAVALAVTGEGQLDAPSRREDLRAWNAQTIARLVVHPPSELHAQLDAALAQAADRAQSLTPKQALAQAFLAAYNRPARALDFLDWQITHAGIVHGSQITRPVRPTPLWQGYSAAMIQRTLDRFVRNLSYVYWPAYGPTTPTVLNLRINGAAGGDWHLIAAPDGGAWGVECREDAPYTFTFDSPATFFGVFTVHVPLRAALEDGRLRIEGERLSALQLLRLFSPSPPR